MRGYLNLNDKKRINGHQVGNFYRHPICWKQSYILFSLRWSRLRSWITFLKLRMEVLDQGACCQMIISTYLANSRCVTARAVWWVDFKHFAKRQLINRRVWTLFLHREPQRGAGQLLHVTESRCLDGAYKNEHKENLFHRLHDVPISRQLLSQDRQSLKQKHRQKVSSYIKRSTDDSNGTGK